MKTSAGQMLGRMVLPVLIGLAVTFWLFRNEFGNDTFADFEWSWRMVSGFAMACLFVVGRDLGLAWRFHTIATPTLSWRRAFRVDLMCAFTSAVTPSAMGGSAFAIFYLNREGVKLGTATTMTLTTLFLDELFFVIFCPIILLIVPMGELFGSGADSAFLSGVEIVFWLVYAGIVVWTTILFMGILVYPQAVARLINKIFTWRPLRRWAKGAAEMGNNMIEASRRVRSAGLSWWFNIFGATILSWFSRYLVVNALFWAFVPGSPGLLVFARQFVVWVVLMVSPTPGGSGISEWLFTEYYGDLIGAASTALVLALTWRLLSYYLYLIIGPTLIPGYFGHRKSQQSVTE